MRCSGGVTNQPQLLDLGHGDSQHVVYLLESRFTARLRGFGNANQEVSPERIGTPVLARLGIAHNLGDEVQVAHAGKELHDSAEPTIGIDLLERSLR